MTDPLTIRCSWLPGLWRCPGSLAARIRADQEEDEPSENAAAGTAVHGLIASALLQPDRRPTDEAKEIHLAGRNAVEVMPLVYQALNFVESFGLTVEGVECKVGSRFGQRDDGLMLTGHIDLRATDGEGLILPDWKCGNTYDSSAQMMGYAACELYGDWFKQNAERLKEKLSVRVATVWLRSGNIDVETVTAAQAAGWVGQLRRRLDSKRFKAGNIQCRFCDDVQHCMDHKKYLAEAASELLPMFPKVETFQPLDRFTLGEMYPRVLEIEGACKRYREAVRMAARQGPLPDGEGNELTLDETEQEEIDLGVAWDILKDHKTLAEKGILKVTKGRYLEHIAADVPKGGKSAAKDAAMEALRKADAVSVKLVTTLRSRKVQKPKVETKELFEEGAGDDKA